MVAADSAEQNTSPLLSGNENPLRGNASEGAGSEPQLARPCVSSPALRQGWTPLPSPPWIITISNPWMIASGYRPPLLANIYLHWFDKKLHRHDGPANWAKARLTRYADDFVIQARHQGSRLQGWKNYFKVGLLPEGIPKNQLLRPVPDGQAPQPSQSTRLQTSQREQCLCLSQTGPHSAVNRARGGVHACDEALAGKP